MRQNPGLPDKTTCLFVGFALGMLTENGQFNLHFIAGLLTFYGLPRLRQRRRFVSDQIFATGLGFCAGRVGMFFLRSFAQPMVSFISENIPKL